MKQLFILFALLIICITGCGTPNISYQSDATITPANEPGQYNVDFVLTDISNTEPKIISNPKILVLKGEEGTISVGNELDQIVWTVLVDDIDGKTEAKTTVNVTKDGKIIWTHEKTILVST